MVGAHQNLNGSRDLTTPLSGIVCNAWLAIATVNLPIKFEVFNYSLRGYERQDKMSKMGWFGVVRITKGHWK